MGIRETLNQNPKLATPLTVGVIAVALGVITFQVLEGRSRRPMLPTKAFFTVDSGQTVFVDELTRVSPFEYQGQTAFRAFVYTCDKGKTRFVAYLERTVPDPAFINQGGSINVQPGTNTPTTGPATLPSSQIEGYPVASQVRKPGDAQWTLLGDYPNALHILSVNCPDGTAATPVMP